MKTTQRERKKANKRHTPTACRQRVQFAKDVRAATSFMLSVNVFLSGIGVCAVLAGIAYGARIFDMIACSLIYAMALLLASAPVIVAKDISKLVEEKCSKHVQNESHRYTT